MNTLLVTVYIAELTLGANHYRDAKMKAMKSVKLLGENHRKDMPAAGGAGDIGGAQEAWKFITDLCWRHRVRGEWCEFDGPLPREMLNRGEGWPLAAGGGGEK